MGVVPARARKILRIGPHASPWCAARASCADCPWVRGKPRWQRSPSLRGRERTRMNSWVKRKSRLRVIGDRQTCDVFAASRPPGTPPIRPEFIMSIFLRTTPALFRWTALAATGSWLSLSLSGQSAPRPAAPRAGVAGEETVMLTPFEVATTQDTGYAGQDTLSGSRLRTNLKDVAAAISPMTAEFLRDIAATNVESAME